VSALVLGFFVSLVGLAAFVYGRKTSQFVPLIGGVILMIYPYFVPNVYAMGLIAIVVVIGMVLFRDE